MEYTYAIYYMNGTRSSVGDG